MTDIKWLELSRDIILPEFARTLLENSKTMRLFDANRWEAHASIDQQFAIWISNRRWSVFHNNPEKLFSEQFRTAQEAREFCRDLFEIHKVRASA